MKWPSPLLIIILLSGCGSHITIESGNFLGKLEFGTEEEDKRVLSLLEGETILGGYTGGENLVNRSEYYWTVMGGPFKGPTSVGDHFFPQENSAELDVTDMEVISEFTWADVLLGWIPGLSRRTVKIRGRYK